MIDLTSLTPEQQATAIYIGYYDRAADPDGLSFWVTNGVNNPDVSLADIGDMFAAAAETIAAYPFFSNPTQAGADAFIGQVYLNLFNRAPDAAGQAFYTDALLKSIDGTSDYSVGQIIVDIIKGAQDGPEGNDRTTILNKIEAGLAWTDAAAAANIDYVFGSPEEQSAKDVINDVNDTQASVDQAKDSAARFFDAIELTASANSVDEGGSIVLDVTNALADTTYTYTITGDVDAADINPEVGLSGTFVTNADGEFSGSIKALADNLTEGAETLTFSVDGTDQSVDVDINDTSLTPPPFTLTEAKDLVNEGEANTFTVTLDAAATEDTTVTFQLAPGDSTAIDQGSNNTNLNDFGIGAFNPVTATIKAGDTTATFDVTALIDGKTELPEGYTVTATVNGESLSESSTVLDSAGPAVGKEFTLTPNTDQGTAFVGTAQDDVYLAGLNADKATLTAGDVLDGQGGTDTLNAAVTDDLAGFRADNIEVFNINNQIKGATVDVGDSKGFTAIWSDNSNQNLAVTGVGDDAVIGLRSTSNSMTVTFDQGAIKDGAVDIALMNAGSNPDLTVNANFTANNSNGAAGVDANLSGTNTTDVTAINISSMGSDNRISLADTGSTKIDTLTISGTANTFVNAPLSQGLQGLKTITSTATGNVVVVSASTPGAPENVDQTVTFGGGDDRYVMSAASLNGKDTVDLGDGADEFELHFGGAGIDLTTANNANLAGLNASKNVETAILDVWATTAETVKFKASDVTGINNFVIQDTQVDGGANNVTDADIEGDITVTGVENDDTFSIKGDAKGDLSFTGATGATKLGLTLNNDIEAAKKLSTDLTDVNVAVTYKKADDAANDQFDAEFSLSKDAAKVTLSGTSDAKMVVDLSGAGKGTTLDASGITTTLTSTESNTLNGSALDNTILGTAQNDVITGNAGDDVLTGNAGDDNITGGAGADVLTGGEGKDTFVYVANTDSQGLKADTITDFVQGTDTIDLTATTIGTGGGVGQGIVAATQFLGNADTLGAANSALNGGGNIEAVYIKGDALYVDADNSGDINANDLRIVVQNGGVAITELKAQDLGLDVDGVTFTANKPQFDTSRTADSNEGVKVGTANDTINATVAQIANSTIDGLAGKDTLNVTGTGTADLNGATTFAGIETVTLGNTTDGLTASSTLVNGITTITGDAAKAQTLTVTGGGTADLKVVGLTKVETLAFGAAGEIRVDEDSFADLQAIVGSTGADTLELNGNAAGDAFDFTSKVLTGVETLDLVQTSSVTLDVVDINGGLNAITGIAGAALTITGPANIASIFTGNVADDAVASLNVTGDITLNAANDGDIFESIVGTGGGRTITTAGTGAFNLAQLSGISTINASSLADDDVLSIADNIGSETIAITLGDSDLSATVGSNNYNVTAAGGVGNQTINTSGGADTLTASAAATNLSANLAGGDDTVNAGAFLTKVDIIDGGANTDTLNVTNDTAADDLDGVRGFEVLNITNTNATSYTLADATFSSNFTINALAAQNVTIVATAEDDSSMTYNGNSAVDTITGTGVADVINGGAGDDILVAGAGNDTVNGGADNDTITGTSGTNALNGNDGDDIITGGSDVDTIDGGAGNDTIRASAGDDRVTLGTGNDIVILTTAANTFGGTDTIVDFVSGNATGNDQITMDLTNAAVINSGTTVAALAATDAGDLVILNSAQTTAEITGTNSAVAVANTAIAVFNSSTGKGEIWFDTDWADAANRVQVATIDSLDSLVEIQGLSASNGVDFNII